MHAPGLELDRYYSAFFCQHCFGYSLARFLWPSEADMYQIKAKLEICSIACEECVCVCVDTTRKRKRYRLKAPMIWILSRKRQTYRERESQRDPSIWIVLWLPTGVPSFAMERNKCPGTPPEISLLYICFKARMDTCSLQKGLATQTGVGALVDEIPLQSTLNMLSEGIQFNEQATAVPMHRRLSWDDIFRTIHVVQSISASQAKHSTQSVQKQYSFLVF